MRRIVILALSLFCANSSAEFRGRILTYRQLMQLPVKKRAQYIQDVRNLVAALEIQQLEKEKKFSESKYAWVGNLKNFAGLLRAFPEAEASLTDGDRKRPIYDPLISTDAQSSPEVDQEGGPNKEPITRNIMEDEDDTPPPAEPASQEEPKEVVRDKSGPDKTANGEAGVQLEETQPSCTIPEKLECEGLSAKDRDEGIKRFRTDDKVSTCISGGGFSEYPGGRKVPGGCTILTSWAGKTCPGGQAMCNPVAFGAIKYDADKRPVNFQLVCVPKSSNGKFDITNRCGKCPMKEGWEHVKNPDDFLTLVKLKDQDGKFGGEFIKSWNELRQSLAKNFNDRCLSEQGKFFRAAFCQECKILGQRIANMNRSVLKSACAGNYDESENTKPGSITPKPGKLGDGDPNTGK